MTREMEEAPICNLSTYDFRKMMRDTIASGVFIGMLAASLFGGMVAVVLTVLL